MKGPLLNLSPLQNDSLYHKVFITLGLGSKLYLRTSYYLYLDKIGILEQFYHSSAKNFFNLFTAVFGQLSNMNLWCTRQRFYI